MHKKRNSKPDEIVLKLSRREVAVIRISLGTMVGFARYMDASPAAKSLAMAALGTKGLPADEIPTEKEVQQTITRVLVQTR
jgi:hypothetical protein